MKNSAKGFQTDSMVRAMPFFWVGSRCLLGSPMTNAVSIAGSASAAQAR